MAESIFAAVRAALDSCSVQEVSNPSLKPAAVLVLFTGAQEDRAVVLTKRSKCVEHHRGEISFPGGAWEPQDRDLLTTALRETQEEIGVPPVQVQVLGRLPQIVLARTRYLISPYVGILAQPCTFQPNPFEVEEVFTVPFAWLLDPQSRSRESVILEGKPVVRESYRYQSYHIWGATARVLTSLIDLVAEHAQKGRPWRDLSPTLQP